LGKQDGFFSEFLRHINDIKTLGINFGAVVIKDNQNQQGQELKSIFPDINTISENDFLNIYKNEEIILFSQNWIEDKNWLVKNGIKRDKIVVLFDFFYPQYFSKDIIIPKEREIFVDGGAFNMGSSVDFINWCNGKYDYIYAFEPDLNNYENCKNVIENKDVFMGGDKIMLYNKGLFNQTRQLRFNSLSINPAGSYISNDGQSMNKHCFY
jgi:hypothetical protein